MSRRRRRRRTTALALLVQILSLLSSEATAKCFNINITGTIQDFVTIAGRRSVITGVTEGVIDTSSSSGNVCSYEFVGPFPESEIRINFDEKTMGGGGLVILDGVNGTLHSRPVKIYRVVQ